MTKIKYKNGSHVGIMISFAIFILFIFFVYMIIKPAFSFKDKQNILTNLKRDLVEKASAELITLSVSIPESPRVCTRLNNFFSENLQNRKLIAKTDSGEIFVLRNNPENNNLQVLNNYNSFFRIYGSEEFEQIPAENPGQCPDSNYEMGNLKKEKVIFEKKILFLIQKYESDYNNLKNELEISSKNDFSFEFVYANKTKVSTKETNITGSVFAEKIPVIYITKNASIEAGNLFIKIW